MIATPVYTPVPLRDSNMAIDFPWSFPPKPPFSHGLQQRTSWGEGPPWITGLYLSTRPI